MAAVLLAIRAGHRYGFDMLGVTSLPNGTVYLLLRRLERGYVVAGAWENEARAREERRRRGATIG